jgi:UDP-N-acetylmuramoylalanine--D-glutamate ligase
LKIPDLLLPHLSRPVAVFGGGASGQGVRALVAALGGKTTVYDEQGAPFTPSSARSHALAVFSPGFEPRHPWIALARDSGCLCLGELDFASLCWAGRVVAITGTNGKTTLTEFLVHALTSTGADAWPAGNIGRAFSAVAAEAQGADPESIAICEVSSFQAETLEHFQADAVLWTNFAEDHLERHRTLESYFAAKARLAGRGAAVFAGSSVRALAEKFGKGWEVAPHLARAAWVPTENQPADPLLAGTVFADYPQRENFILAAAWWRSTGRDATALYDAARTFRLGRHRLARVAEIDGVIYWNDSKATNFHAVEAALGRFPEPVILIAGGRAKGGDLAGFVRRIAGHVRHCCLIGETRMELARYCAEAGIAHTVCASLAEAIERAGEAARPGDHVLLSPGFASFDMFRSYEDRGDQFERALKYH